MSRIARLIALVILCISSAVALVSWADEQSSCVGAASKNIVVEIDYGEVRPFRTVEVPRIKGRTALEVLQLAAEVKTHPVGQYVFVISIDGVEGKRGEMAWYYTVDGKSADKLAYSNIVGDNVGHIRWVYKKDVCSRKVDGRI
jgi:hypothetical protein